MTPQPGTDTAHCVFEAETTRIAAAYKGHLTARMSELPAQPIVALTGSSAELEAAVQERRRLLRDSILRFPAERAPLHGRTLAQEETSTHRMEKVIFQSEPGSWVTALLYRPLRVSAPGPALVLASGHGGGKGSLHNQVAAQLFAQLGLTVIVPDTIGEEDRFEPWGLGLRGHRYEYALDRLNERGRPFIARNVYDLSRSLDYLLERDEVDPKRIGCAGSSMGGTTTQLLIAADDRFTLCLNSAWAADYKLLNVGHSHSKGCCWRLPGILHLANQEDLFALAAPHCATLIMSGADDEICPPHGLEAMATRLKAWWSRWNAPERFDCLIRPNAGHRQYHTTLPALRWLRQHFHLELPLPEDECERDTIGLGEIVEGQGYKLQPLYDVERHHRGTRTLRRPFTIREPESTAILSDATLAEIGLERDAFTLQGWLRLNEAPEADRVTTQPETRTAFHGGLPAYLHALLNHGEPRPEAPLPPKPAAISRAPAETDTQPTHHPPEDWLIALDALTLRVHRPLQSAEAAVLYLGPQRTHAAGSPAAAVPASLAVDTTLLAVPDLVRLNDEELLIGDSSLAFNLRLGARCLRLLRERYGIEHIEIVTAIPRLGALLAAADPAVAGLTARWSCFAEQAESIAYRLENVLPGFARHFRWLDVYLAIAPRPMALPRGGFTAAAQRELAAAYAAAPPAGACGPGDAPRLLWHDEAPAAGSEIDRV